MLTVLFRDSDCTESVQQAARISYHNGKVEAFTEDGVTVLAVGVSDEHGGDNGCTVFVMNESGATVAKYGA